MNPFAINLPPTTLFTSIEDAKAAAPRMKFMGENQFIIGTPTECRIMTAFGPMGSDIQKINGNQVLSSRCWSGTDYANDQQSPWSDR